jgi:hypothetical protein
MTSRDQVRGFWFLAAVFVAWLAFLLQSASGRTLER